MREILIITILSLISFSSHSQCYLQYLPEEGDHNQEPSSGHNELDKKINEECRSIALMFGITFTFNYFDDSSAPNAYATCQCNRSSCNGGIEMGTTLLVDEIYQYHGGMDAVRGILAHEGAHILQCKYGWEGVGRNKELHADFLAGYYLARKSYFEGINFLEFASSLYKKGDYNFWSDQHHGTPKQRIQFMLVGACHSEVPVKNAFLIGKKYAANGIRGYKGELASYDGNNLLIKIDNNGNMNYSINYSGENGSYIIKSKSKTKIKN